jgi:plasmid stabilization system protein ParE
LIRQLVPQLSKQAQRDLAAVYRDIARENPVAAARLLEELDDKINALARSGYTGVARDWLSPGLRAFPFKNRCIYFRVSGSAMRVIRVIHGRQEVTPELFENED